MILENKIVQYLEDKLIEKPLFVQLVKQLEKDLQLSVSADLDIKAQTPSDLVNELQYLLESIAVNYPARFSNLLYRIDVPESEVNSLKSGDLAEYLQQMTFLILKREFQKVYIRSTM